MATGTGLLVIRLFYLHVVALQYVKRRMPQLYNSHCI